MNNAAWFFLSSDQFDRVTVADDIGIPGKQRDAFDTRLSNEHAVERIPMNQRQSGDFENVFRPNLKFVIAILHQVVPQSRWFDRKVLPAERLLDDNFPNACSTEHWRRSEIREKGSGL